MPVQRLLGVPTVPAAVRPGTSVPAAATVAVTAAAATGAALHPASGGQARAPARPGGSAVLPVGESQRAVSPPRASTSCACAELSPCARPRPGGHDGVPGAAAGRAGGAGELRSMGAAASRARSLEYHGKAQIVGTGGARQPASQQAPVENRAGYDKGECGDAGNNGGRTQPFAVNTACIVGRNGVSAPEDLVQALEDKLAELAAGLEERVVAAVTLQVRQHTCDGPLCKSINRAAEYAAEPPFLVDALNTLRQELRTETTVRERVCKHLESLIEHEARLRQEGVAAEARRWEDVSARLDQHRPAGPSELDAELRAELRAAVVRSQELADALAAVRDGPLHGPQGGPCDTAALQSELARFCGQLQREVRGLHALEAGRDAAPGGGPSSSLAADVGNALRGAFSEERQCLLLSLQDAERRMQTQLDAALEEMRALSHNQLQAHDEAQKQHQDAMEHEVKEREEICHMLLTYLEDKVQEERQRWDQKLQEEQRHLEDQLQRGLHRCEHDLSAHRQFTLKSLQDGLHEERKRCEEGLCASEQVIQTHLSTLVGGVEERCSQELLTARQSLLQGLLELRQELSDGLKVEKESREEVSMRLHALMERAAGDEDADDRVEEWRALQEQHGRLRELHEGQETRLGALRSDVYRELERTAGQSREVLGALGGTRSALAACRDEVAGLRDGLERLRERVDRRTAAGEEAQEVGVGAGRELRAAVEAEARLREEADDRLLAQARELVREERQGREQGHRALELGVQSVRELLFVDGGKREERDRDIQIQIAKVDEDLDAVRRHLAIHTRQ